VDVLLGNGDGSFKSALVVRAGHYPSAVTVGDFNGDGKLDLAVTNTCFDYYCDGNGGVTLLLGDGTGRFVVASQVDLSERPGWLAAGDFNRDGKLDVAVTGDVLFILLGNGDGTFQPALDTAVVGFTVAVGDFNRDGNLDVAVTAADVAVLLGNGDGTFQAAQHSAAGSNPWSVATADFNHDGNLDAVVVEVLGSTVDVLLGNGDGTFLLPVGFNVGQNNPTFVAVGDFNGDSKEDLAVVAMDANRQDFVSVLLNTSTR